MQAQCGRSASSGIATAITAKRETMMKSLLSICMVRGVLANVMPYWCGIKLAFATFYRRKHSVCSARSRDPHGPVSRGI